MSQQQPISEAMYYVLLSLLKPTYGYEIMKNIKTISGGRINMGPGTLYGILSRMVKDGLIVLEEIEDRKKIYCLTDLGKEVFNEEYERMKRVIKDAMEVMQDEGS